MTKPFFHLTILLALVLCLCTATHADVFKDAATGDVAAVRAYLDARGDVNAGDPAGATALHHAVAGNQVGVVKLLIERNADVNAAKLDGVTPLHVAAAMRRVEIAEILLSAGADRSAKDKKGRTPRQCVPATGSQEVARLLDDPSDTTSATYQTSLPSGPSPGDPWIFPILGVKSFTDTFGADRPGRPKGQIGQDLMAPKMREEVAAFNGVVYPLPGATHNMLSLVGDNGLSAMYMHINNDTPGTKDRQGTALYAFPPGIEGGTRVCAGQHIAWCGDSGNAKGKGSHLHFELSREGTLNPAEFLRAAKHISTPAPVKPVIYLPDASGGAVKNFDARVASTHTPLTALPASVVRITDPQWTALTPTSPAQASSSSPDGQVIEAGWQVLLASKLSLLGTGGQGYQMSLDEEALLLPEMMKRHGDAQYLDLFERLLYNVLLVNPASASQTLQRLGGMVYVRNGTHLYVNMYVASESSFTLANTPITIMQSTDYPKSGLVTLTLQPERPIYASLILRIPGWAQERPLASEAYYYLDRESPLFTVRINGTTINPGRVRQGYIAIPGQWRAGDQIVLDLPMPVRRVLIKGAEQIVAIERGPIVFAPVGVGASAALADSDVLSPVEAAGVRGGMAIRTEANGVTREFRPVATAKADTIWMGRTMAGGVAPMITYLTPRHWRMLGPIPCALDSEFDTRYGKSMLGQWPEEGVVSSDGTVMPWYPLKESGGFIDLNRVFGQQQNVCAYILTTLDCPSERAAILSVGSDDGLKVWLDGDLLIRKDVQRSAAPGQDQARVNLTAGRHELLLKVSQAGGGWGYYCDLLDAQGRPMQDVAWGP